MDVSVPERLKALMGKALRFYVRQFLRVMGFYLRMFVFTFLCMILILVARKLIGLAIPLPLPSETEVAVVSLVSMVVGGVASVGYAYFSSRRRAKNKV